MKVKIGNTIYDSNVEPIMLILEDYNKEHISQMNKDNNKYCEYPENISEEYVKNFMKV